MVLKWKRENTKLLIDLIKQYPCLYDTHSSEFLDREKKAHAFNNVLDAMWSSMGCISLHDVKQKWKGVKSQYAQEKRMLSDAKRSGSAYVPKLWCFSQLSFLETKTDQSDDNVLEIDEDNIHYIQTGAEEECLIEISPVTEKDNYEDNISYIQIGTEEESHIEDSSPKKKKVTYGMSLKWKRENTKLLINLIEQYPCLYDTENSDRLDREKRAQAFSNILEVMWNSMDSISLHDVKQKWKGIKSQYAHEQRMLSDAKKFGSAYVPKLWCFKQLSFLERNRKTKQSEDNLMEDDEDNISDVQNGTVDECHIEEPPQKKKCVMDVKETRSNQKQEKIKIECLKLEEKKCRICSQEDVKVDWNNYLRDNDYLTYKDCYYKYTQLDYFDGDNLHLSNMLCRSCSNSLEKIDTFITKAIEHHNLLMKRLSVNVETTSFETVLMLETDTDIKAETQNGFMNEETNKEYINEESDSGSIAEDIKSPSTERKEERRCKMDNAQISANELKSDKPILKKNKSVKQVRTPTYCSKCPKVLASKYKAIEHEKTHYKTSRERNHVCSVCGMKFYDKVVLTSHMKIHNENREKTHKCEFCDKAFYNSGGLNIHRRIHLGLMYPCKLCAKKYYRQIDLDKHMISHSASRINGDVVKPSKKYFVYCNICNATVRSVQYKTHSARHRNEPLAKCGICDKEFFSRESCISHLKKVHKKTIGEMNNFVIAFKKSRYSNLYLQQNVGNIFTIE